MLLTPHYIRRLLRFLPPLSFGVMLVLLGNGIYQALWVSPPDYQQGEAVRMMYVHVPSAWLALGIYMAMAACAASYVIWRFPLAEVTVRALAPIGATFAAITLLTGALWGKPIWGTWWVWDPRLTSMFVLFCQYIACLLFGNSREGVSERLCIWILLGAINIPIIKFSVEFWHSLHQPASILRAGGMAIAPEMLRPLFYMALASVFYTLTIAAMRIRTEQLRRKVRRKQWIIGQERTK